MPLSNEVLMYMTHHVFLPSQLPGKSDTEASHDTALLDTMISSLQSLKQFIELEQMASVDLVIAMLTNLSTVRDTDGSVSEEELANLLRNLGKKGGIIPLHISAQNAALIISKVDESVHLEAFELSPPNQAVNTVKGRLRRAFPGPAIAMDREIFNQPSLQATISQTLAKMSSQSAVGTKPQAKKAGQMHDEDRDTTHPKMVTELFVGFLRSLGAPATVTRLWKNTREEVLWHNSFAPWRRSPLWLLIRVAMQLVFAKPTKLSNSGGDTYKISIVFFMTKTLEAALELTFASDVLYSMSAKIVRRLLKLGTAINGTTRQFIENVLQRTNDCLRTRWSDFRDREMRLIDLSQLSTLDFERDTANFLPELDKYIDSINSRKRNQGSTTFQPSSGFVQFDANKLPSNLKGWTAEYTPYNLKSFETWVSLNLDPWLETHKESLKTCADLGGLIRNYHAIASESYSGNPEGISLMLLTLLELWVASDKSATKICCLLSDYDPGVPQQLLESLVLPFRSQMARLSCMEDYLSERRSHAKYLSPHIFQDFGSPSSFAAKYFDLSSEHQTLRTTIRAKAASDRQKKCDELRKLKAEYDRLMQLHDQSNCQFEEYRDLSRGIDETRHSYSCLKCSYSTQANNLDIRVHEWPLPNDEWEERCTVFELKVPESFGHWRDTTLFILMNVLRSDYTSDESPRATYHLAVYSGLSAFFSAFGSFQRAGLLSQDKPHEVTHRKQKSISTATQSDICLSNGCSYQYFDNITSSFIKALATTNEIPDACTYRLPVQSSSLQKFMFRPAAAPSGPSPNTVLACQYECPDHMSLDEYKTLSTIPLGFRIQWFQILRELVSPSVDFKKLETSLVILQTVYQAGPQETGSILRQSHLILENESFARNLMEALHTALQRVKENWESAQALQTFTSVTLRLLSLSSSSEIREQCLAYLAKLRIITFSWVNLLRQKAQSASSDAQRTDLGAKAIEVALTCVDTFNVDERFLDHVLSVPEAATTLIECNMVIQEADLTISKTIEPMTSLLYRRWKAFSHRCRTIMANEICVKQNPCLDEAVKRSWADYQPGYGWQVVDAPNGVDHWLVTQATPEDTSIPIWLHFNLLDSELLVDGVPLARLPAEYERHPLYSTLFRNSTIEVMPTATPGMKYSGKQEFSGYTLQFGLSSSFGTSDLLVQATKGAQKMELVPSRLLLGYFPTAFVDNFVHWYDFENRSMIFRPNRDPWTPSADNWILAKSTGGSKWYLTKDGNCLVSVKSETSQLTSRVLSPLEDPLMIHGIFNQESLSLEIELPKLGLGFSLKSRQSSFQSKQFRGMSIDSDQSIGTLIGLSNKLVLKDEKQGSRRFIVPQGLVSSQIIDSYGHVRVNVDKPSATKFHVYDLNTRLGTLVGNYNLQSKLFLCYLHAVTSSCLPDPLTMMTGTEQALSILNSAGVRSFDRLTPENIICLEQIANLTPVRTYYPANERVMQQVEWSPRLGFLAQHGGFYMAVKSIFRQADLSSFFYPAGNLKLPNMDKMNQELLDRDCVRSSTFRVSGYGAEDHTAKHDAEHSARHASALSAPGDRALSISRTIYSDSNAIPLSATSSLALKGQLWNFLKQNAPKILGSSNALKSSRLYYDSSLLVKGNKFFAEYWPALHQNLGKGESWIDKFRLMMFLSTLAFSDQADMDILQVLASFYTVPAMSQIQIPTMETFKLSDGAEAQRYEIRNIITKGTLVPLHRCPEASIPAFTSETKIECQARRQRTFQSAQDRAANQVADGLLSQFPCEIPIPVTSLPCSNYIELEKAANMVKPKFKSWFANHSFYEYLDVIEKKLMGQSFAPIPIPPFTYPSPKYDVGRNHCGFISIDGMFKDAAPPNLPSSVPMVTNSLLASGNPETNLLRLTELISRLDAQAFSKYEREYVADLQESITSLKTRKEIHHLKCRLNLEVILTQHLENCNNRCDAIYIAIKSALIHSSNGISLTAFRAKQWPRLSPILLLQQLSRDRWAQIQDWQDCIIQFGLALTELQRAERLVNSLGNHSALVKELETPGHTNWDPLEQPESLLLEVESGIMIREVQQQIAQRMSEPLSNKNAVMQLNMGEGKSSVIVPIVAAALANGSSLVRVIVAKPQSKQMFQMLISKLGGLLNRRVYHMPFSRELRLGTAEAGAIHNMCRECMETGGILLVQPEHILSFKLMGLECLITGKEAVGKSLLGTQEFFEQSSRDIVDESDENFSVKFELIYTMGKQRPIELSPERWIVIQEVLNHVRKFVPSAQKDHRDSIEVINSQAGGFPRIRFLQPAVGQEILGRVAKHICETGFNGFPIARQACSFRQAVFTYITEQTLTAEKISQVEEGEFWTDATRSTLLLLRGLLAGGVLAFAFGHKRWKVNYGLHSTRTPDTRLAVPYRYNDTPAPRSEFSHPDVVIVLTSLSVYYEGLKDDALFITLGHLLKSDQAPEEYQEWVKDAPELPTAFRNISGINVRDKNQCVEKVFPFLRYAKAAVDYYLAHIVFPKEMKEFPHKLSASGWDIGQKKTLPTTGFSGTNDSRKVLPLSVGHLDLLEQKHTNALVLGHILQTENAVAMMPSREAKYGSDAELLMTMVTNMNPAVRVILDVGAQILELSNIMVAKKWLEMIPDHETTQAAVFCDDSDELCVLDRKGQVETWHTSSFAKHPDACVIFLDESHTRGTDLKLPIHYRAAVTLGPNLTKDRLVQACMRMRQLGHGQSVVFCIPPEIKDKILMRKTKRDEAEIDVSDVLEWAISETSLDIRRSMPLWMTQGNRFEMQSTLWDEARSSGLSNMPPDLANRFLEEEAQSLNDRYRPRLHTDLASCMRPGQNKNLNMIIERCQEFKDLEFSSSTLQEEQERELSPEIEAEQQRPKPAPAEAAKHKVDKDLMDFVIQGTLVPGSEAYKPAFDVLADTSAAAHLDVSQFPRDLLVTADFASTIVTSGKSYISDSYQRPVQWVLTSTGKMKVVRTMMVISPFEAHELLPYISASDSVTLHIYSPRPNLGFRRLDGLDLYTVPVQPTMPTLPRELTIQLNLFAGQLYFSSYQEYIDVCQVLGLAHEKTTAGTVVDSDGFIVSRDGSAGPGVQCTFKDSPVTFLKVLMTKIRRNCEGIDKTHMGHVLGGVVLSPADLEMSEDLGLNDREGGRPEL
ncbi:hypothetical protein LZ554_007268 [Drepanopeziza brunnea f. sp. 'monogermtubi']|nr:hypothetical protein LZ554_007268 [Drepanopeziza brunnea f. sp. 'monogermtubi']